MHYREIKEKASKFRRNPTASESILWKELKNRKVLGRKFLRQHPIIYQVIGQECFFFIPDFYCAQEHLVIELDGGIHDHLKEKDYRRDKILRSRGFKILRIDNSELAEIKSVLEKITNKFSKT